MPGKLGDPGRRLAVALLALSALACAAPPAGPPPGGGDTRIEPGGASRGILLQIMISSVTGSGGVDPAKVGEIGTDIVLGVYSRDQEETADRLAVSALQRQYGHVGGATRLFEALQGAYGDDEIPEILSSHPDIADRIETIMAFAAEQGWNSGTTSPYPSDVQEALSSRP